MNYRVTAVGGLNVRSGPGTQYAVEATLVTDQVVESPDTTGWVPVVLEDVDTGEETLGWASTKYLTEVTEVPTAPEPPTTAVTGARVVARAMTQAGDPYIFGYEVNLDDPDPEAFDCSELVQWVCAQLGVKPTMPDGAANQADHCRNYGTTISVEEAVKTAGALLFRLYSSGNHVVISRGDGSTIEAKGSAYGVGVFSTAGRGWNYAARIPGVVYA